MRRKLRFALTALEGGDKPAGALAKRIHTVGQLPTYEDALREAFRALSRVLARPPATS